MADLRVHILCSHRLEHKYPEADKRRKDLNFDFASALFFGFIHGSVGSVSFTLYSTKSVFFCVWSGEKERKTENNIGKLKRVYKRGRIAQSTNDGCLQFFLLASGKRASSYVSVSLCIVHFQRIFRELKFGGASPLRDHV